MRRSAQAGFTLLEVTMVMAITGLLLLLLTHQHSTAATSAFTGGIDSIRNTIAGVKNEAASTVNTEGCGGFSPTDPSCNSTLGNSGFYYVAWGKEIKISGTTMSIYTIRAKVDASGNLQPPAQDYLDRTVTLPNGISMSGSKTALFLRDVNTGGLRFYFPSGGMSNNPSQDACTPGPNCPATLTFSLVGPEGGHQGDVYLDQTSLSITTRNVK